MFAVFIYYNEIEVEKFLASKIGFLDIPKITLDALKKFSHVKANTIDDVFLIDEEVRSYCES